MDASQRHRVDVATRRLKETSDLLQHWLEGLTDLGPLVFCKPPPSSAIPLHLQPPRSSLHDDVEDIFALRHNAHENTQYLQAEDWLYDHHTDVSALLEHESTEVRLRASVLCIDLEDALRDLDQKKMLEWERQRSSGHPVNSTTPSRDGIINTGLLKLLFI